MSLLGVDIGSTGCKAAVYTEQGRLISSSYKEYKVLYKGQSAELKPQKVWECVKACIKKVVLDCGNDTVKALSVSSMSDTFTPFDKDGKPLTHSVMSFDSRAGLEVEELKESCDSYELYMLSGMPMHPMHPLFKLKWINKNMPKLQKRVWKFMFYEDYILYMLGACPCVSYSNAGRSMLFDYTEKKWAKALLEKCGIDETKLPETHPSGTVVGEVSEQASVMTGLPARAKLVVGGFDQACCAAACGVLEKGNVVDTTGTNEIFFLLPT